MLQRVKEKTYRVHVFVIFDHFPDIFISRLDRLGQVATPRYNGTKSTKTFVHSCFCNDTNLLNCQLLIHFRLSSRILSSFGKALSVSAKLLGCGSGRVVVSDQRGPTF